MKGAIRKAEDRALFKRAIERVGLTLPRSGLARSFDEALEWTARVYQAAGRLLGEREALYGVADEGGYWPAFDTNEQGLELLVRAIERAAKEG